MNKRIAKKVNVRTAGAVYGEKPVPYTRGQIRKACHCLRRHGASPYRATVMAAVPNRWRWVAVSRGRFPWEIRSKEKRIDPLSSVFRGLGFAAQRTAESMQDFRAAFSDDRLDALVRMCKRVQANALGAV